ncbi:glycoside hydrolase family 31 protein [Pontiellaceae bacterium B12219]|nr:glycoside hydrolase family 31 protein [Pontiellaceae bacterium B12219]
MFNFVQHETSGVFAANGKRLKITFMNSETVRVSYIEADAFVEGESAIVTAPASHSGFTVAEENDSVVLSTSDLKVSVSKKSGAIGFMDAAGNVLQQEPARGGKSLIKKDVFRNVYDHSAEVSTGQNIDGARAEGEAVDRIFDRHAFEAKLEFTFADDEALFGLGSHEEGYGNLRGKSQQLYQQNMKMVVPCLVSSKGYGLMWDCSSTMVFHDDAYGSYWWAECVDQIDYYFIGGGNASAIAKNYYALTGTPPLLPRWAFGYVQSKERYVNAEEMLGIAREYRRRNIPLDVLVLDWKSWPDGNGWGQKSFDPARFPDPVKFIDELHAMGVKLMVSIWPIMSGDCPNQIELREQGLMLGNQSTYNAFDSNARKIYWNQANEGLFSKGVDAWWCDCTEPFEADWEGTVKPEPHLRLIKNTDQAKRYLDEGQTNAYSLFHSQGIYDGQRAANDKKRVVNLTRSSYAGQHRYGTISWNGDICATWEVLKRSIPEGVNFCATGEPYWTLDIGAFFVGSDPENRWFWKGDYDAGCRGLGPMEGTEPIANDNGCTDLGYWELYTRWLQYGCFLPMFRSHGTDAAREIWRFGDEGNRFYDTIAKFIRLRYQMLPYIYSVAAGVADAGLALLRPVALVYPTDSNTFDLTDQYFFGPGLMVCPVIQPMYYEQNSQPLERVPEMRPVYLPQGSGWYDFWTGEIHEGGQHIEAAAPLETIPLFVPAGTILPMGPVEQYAGELPEAPLKIHVYTGADASFVWYEDAGDTYAYENGECARVTLKWNEAEQKLNISDREESFEGMVSTRTLKVAFHTVEGLKETEIEYSGKKYVVPPLGGSAE